MERTLGTVIIIKTNKCRNGFHVLHVTPKYIHQKRILINTIYILSIYLGNLPSWMLIYYCSILKNRVVGSANNEYQMMIS